MDISNLTGKEFPKAKRGGLDEFSVHSYLKEIQGSINNLNSENQDLRTKVEEYKKQESALARSLIAAEETAQKTLADAQEEASKILEDSRQEASSILDNANREAEEIKSNALKDVEETLSRLNRLKAFENDFKARILEDIENEKNRFQTDFSSDQMWTASVEAREAENYAVSQDTVPEVEEVPDTEETEDHEEGHIELKSIYEDLPQTEDDLRKLIQEL